MIFWIAYILIEAFIQGKLIEKGYKPSYLVLFLIRAMMSIFQGILLDCQYGTWQYPILLGFQICSFEIIFDFFLNLLRMEKWNYKGKSSGWIDKLSYPWWYTLKGITLIAAIILYILGLQYWSY